jgi:uncharacterized protein (DUF433 family)
MDEEKLLKSITVNTRIFDGKPIITRRTLDVEHVFSMIGTGESPETDSARFPVA